MLRGYYVCLALDTIKIPQERPRLLSNGSLCKKHNRAVAGVVIMNHSHKTADLTALKLL